LVFKVRLLDFIFLREQFSDKSQKTEGGYSHVHNFQTPVPKTSVPTAGVACSASFLFGRSLSARAASEPVRIYVDFETHHLPIDRNLFGSFLEHLGRAIYEGFPIRLQALRLERLPQRCHGRNPPSWASPSFATPAEISSSGYNWLDGVGPKQDRPRVLDRAWNSSNSNQFGTNEFLAWCKAVGTEPLMGLNFGTGTAEQAADLSRVLQHFERHALERPPP